MVKADDRKYYFRQIDKAFFISPIVDMEKVILDMMRWADITEEKLREKQLITTGFGETLSWEYLCYVRNHPVNWSVSTCILYGGIIELVYIVLQSVVKPGITGFFKIDLHIKCYIYLS